MEAGREEKGVDLGEVGGEGGEGGDAVDDVAAVHGGDWVGGGGGFGGRAKTGKEIKVGRSPAGRESRCHYGAGMAAILSFIVFFGRLISAGPKPNPIYYTRVGGKRTLSWATARRRWRTWVGWCLRDDMGEVVVDALDVGVHGGDHVEADADATTDVDEHLDAVASASS
ncbi:hypothetical protein GW17_00022186 [Ensete ventricosum]|nr:hypothetical protein GW17_00022186 [Ensete ventricosum]